MSESLSKELREEIELEISRIPLIKTMNFKLDKLELGICEMSIEPDGSYDGIFVSLAGGVLISLADAAACFAIQTRIGIADTLATTDMNIRFLAPALSNVTAVAKIIKTGRTLAISEVNLYDENKKHLAVSQVTYMRIQKKLDREFRK